jgi:hypothetical protein
MAGSILKKTPKPARLLVARDSLEYQDDQATIKLKLDQSLFSDLEIVDEIKFREYISDFLKRNHLSNRRIIIVFSSDVYFEKKFDSKIGNELEADKFIQMIPFKTKTFHEYQQESGCVLVVVNKSIINNLISSLENNQVNVISVVPQFIETHSSDISFLKKNNLIELGHTKHFSSQFKFKISANRPHILVGIFCLLMLVLIYMIVLSQTRRPAVLERTSSILPTQIITSQTPTPTVSSPAQIKIILNNFKLEKAANQLRDRLLVLGFSDVTSSRSQTSLNSNKIVVTFNIRFPAESKDNILADIRKISRDITIKDSNDIKTGVEIIIGQ